MTQQNVKKERNQGASSSVCPCRANQPDPPIHEDEDSAGLILGIMDGAAGRLVVLNPERRVVFYRLEGQDSSCPQPGEPRPSCHQIIRQCPIACPFCPVPDVFATGNPLRYEEIDARSGRLQELRIIPVFDKYGRVTQVIEHLKEIERRKRPSTALVGLAERRRAANGTADNEEKFRILVEHAPMGISLINDRGNYVYVNPRFSSMFGYTLADIPRGRDWFQKAFPDPADRRRAITLWIKDLEKIGVGEARPRSFEVVCRDGSRKLIAFKPVTLKTGYQLVIYEDLSERQKWEDHLTHTMKMEAIVTLAGGIAHDFNNLLMGIQGRASLMLSMVGPGDPCREHLQDIEIYLKSAADLTRQLLGFAQGGPYDPKPTDLGALAGQSLRLFSRTAKQIIMRENYAPDLWPVEVDRRQIEQVLLNLFVNAAQAMPSGGELRLEARNAELDEETAAVLGLSPGRYVRLMVSDTGVGMDAGIMDRIFDPFFSTKPKGRGTGLGLASAFGIVRKHKGRIGVQSQVGKGTTFTIELPATDREVPAEVSRSLDLTKGIGTVLLVDDEQLVVDVTRPMLERLGFQVLCCLSGREAIDMFKDKGASIDLVILDMIMPEVGGGEVFDQIKLLRPDAKVLLSSGYSLEGQAAEIMSRGCTGFLQKPFNLTRLSRKIAEILK